MGKFVLYTVAGTLATFAIFLHLSLLPHLMQTPAFAGGITFSAVLQEIRVFAMTLALSWISWWGVSGLLSLLLYSLGKYTWFILFILSLCAIVGITLLIT